MKGTKEKGKKGKKGKDKGKKDCDKWGHKEAQCRKQKDQGSKPPAATVHAVASVNQVHSSGGCDDSFWILAVSATSGRDARILVDSGTDAHVCPTSFATATFLAVAKGGMLYDAQRYKIEAHGTRTVYMRWVQSSESQT